MLITLTQLFVHFSKSMYVFLVSVAGGSTIVHHFWLGLGQVVFVHLLGYFGSHYTIIKPFLYFFVAGDSLLLFQVFELFNFRTEVARALSYRNWWWVQFVS